MTDTRVDRISCYGTNAERTAFTPDPPAGVLVIFYEEDTGDVFLWDTDAGPAAWVAWPSSGGATTGTFTPAVTFGGGSTGLTYNYQVGRYARVGNQVTFQLALGINAIGSSTGAMVITGLPLTSKNTTNFYQAAAVGLWYKPGGSNVFRSAYIAPNTTSLAIWDPAAMAAGTQTGVTTGSEINISGTYECVP